MANYAFRNMRPDEANQKVLLAKAYTPGRKPSPYRKVMAVTIANERANTDYIPITFSLTVCREHHQPGQQVAIILLKDLQEGIDAGYYDNRLPTRTQQRLKEQAMSVGYNAKDAFFKKTANYAHEEYNNDGSSNGSAEGEIYHQVPRERLIILSDEEFQEACQYIDEHCNGSRNEKNLMFFDYILARHHFGE